MDGQRRQLFIMRVNFVILSLFILLMLSSGCGDVLDVQPPDLIPAEGLADPENAELLLNGAIGDFECAFGAYVALTGVMAHEMIDATQTAAPVAI